MILAIVLLFAAPAPHVAAPAKPCSFVYINGDAVISCPKGAR